jgi:hypothetical protein
MERSRASLLIVEPVCALAAPPENMTPAHIVVMSSEKVANQAIAEGRLIFFISSPGIKSLKIIEPYSRAQPVAAVARRRLRQPVCRFRSILQVTNFPGFRL